MATACVVGTVVAVTTLGVLKGKGHFFTPLLL
jgi:hypothetical protein